MISVATSGLVAHDNGPGAMSWCSRTFDSDGERSATLAIGIETGLRGRMPLDVHRVNWVYSMEPEIGEMAKWACWHYPVGAGPGSTMRVVPLSGNQDAWTATESMQHT